VALNASATPTAAFVKNPDWQNPAQACVDALTASLGVNAVGTFDAEAASSKLMGDSIYTNPMMLGYAWQRGWVPLGLTALMRAIELNAVQVDKNKQAFEWGRRAAHDPKAMAAVVNPLGQQVIQFKKRESVAELIARRV
jgi:indolepyruvate ferredoxin oxidoreductase